MTDQDTRRASEHKKSKGSRPDATAITRDKMISIGTDNPFHQHNIDKIDDLDTNNGTKQECLNVELAPNTESQVEQQEIVTLSDLIIRDVPNGAMLLEYPSTSNRNLRFVNDEKYLIYDFPPVTAFYNQYLKPVRACPVAGDKIPLLLSVYPTEELAEHWQKWVPGYTAPVIKPMDDYTSANYDVFLTSFPLQQLPKSRHAVDPDVHHKLLSKGTIPYMGTMYPRHTTSESCTFPCMVKAAHGLSTKGTCKADSEEDLQRILSEFNSNLLLGDPPVITELIENIEGNYCLQFYLFKTGEVHWIGVSNQVIDVSGDQFAWGGGIVHWDEQPHLKEALWETVRPVKEYLHKEGYFGVVGIDILTNEQGKYVIDVNPRINGSTPQMLLAPRMAALGHGVSVFLTKVAFLCTAKELVQNANMVNCEGKARVVVFSLADTETRCEAHVAVYAKTEDDARKVYDRLARKD